MMSTILNPNIALKGISTPQWILQSALAALSEGRISEVLDQFDDHFTFTDHALVLEFTDKGRLTEFLHKSRELFPDTVVEVVSIVECGDHAFAEWNLTATQSLPYGSLSLRLPLPLRDTSVVHVKDGRITEWSDCYDQNTSRRVSLAAFFTEWIEY